MKVWIATWDNTDTEVFDASVWTIDKIVDRHEGYENALDDLRAEGEIEEDEDWLYIDDYGSIRLTKVL